MIGRVGDDEFGEQMLNFQQKEGIDITEIKKLNNIPTGRAYITVSKNSDNSIIVMTGANSIWDDSFLDNIYFQKGDVVIAQFEIPDNVIKKTFLKAKKSRAITILNPAPIRNIDKSIKDNTDILIVNKVELEDLANTVINTLDNSIIFTHAKKLLESGYKTIIVTLGG
ncbi:hypothetical protein HOK00_05680 [bacterium]|jgi:ribokinase|nr:hypothetical protein [bacterium]